MDNYENPKPGKTYISPRLTSFGQQKRPVRIASKSIDSETYAFGTIREETVLRRKEGAKTYVKATFF